MEETVLRRETVSRQETWNEAVARLPDPQILQSWEWGAFKERHGWKAERWLWQDGDTTRAAALVLHRAVGRLPLRVMYVPKGPILDYGDSDLFNQVVADLERIGKERRALQVKIDADIPSDTPAGEAVISCLEERGWRPSEEQIQFRSTVLLDLTPSEDDILMDMKSKWRYNIRLAGRRGVKVREGGIEDLPLLYDMYLETARRDEFIIRPEAYYRDAWGSFIEAGLAQPFIAEVEGEAVAMVIIFRFDRRAWYMYGASRSVHRDKMPNHRLQWEAIRWAKAQGCTVYDMWGAPDELDESDPMWGVYRFKIGFGAEFVEHIGAYDYPALRLGYWLYTRLAPRALSMMHLLHRLRTRPGEES